MRSIIRILRTTWPLEAAFSWIRGICYAVEGVDDGLFLLRFERIGLAKHHVLEYLWLCPGNKSKIGRMGQLSCRTTLIGVCSCIFPPAWRVFSPQCISETNSRKCHLAIIVQGNISPMCGPGFETIRHGFMGFRSRFGGSWWAAPESIRARLHSGQYGSSWKIHIGRRCVRPVIGVGEAGIIGRIGSELIQLVL